MAKTGCAGSATAVAPICLNFGITAPVLSWVITWRGRIEMKSPLRTTVPGASPSAWRPAIFSTSVNPISGFSYPRITLINGLENSRQFACFAGKSFLRSAFAKELCDVEVHEIRVVKNDRLNGALYLVAFMTMRRNNMQDFAGNLMFVCERDAAERMTHLLSELSLNYFAWRILIVLERLANIGEKRAGDEMIALNGNATAKRTLQDIRDRDALP